MSQPDGKEVKTCRVRGNQGHKERIQVQSSSLSRAGGISGATQCIDQRAIESDWPGKTYSGQALVFRKEIEEFHTRLLHHQQNLKETQESLKREIESVDEIVKAIEELLLRQVGKTD